jgi:hypothetical protein
VGREYHYRAHIRWGQWVLPVFFAGLAALPLVCRLVFFGTLRGQSALATVVTAVFPLYIALLGVPAWYFYYRLAAVRVSLDEEGIVYKHRGGTMKIPFESVSQLKFAAMRYMGGWIKIVSGGGSIRLTVVVDGIGAFLQELKTALDSRGLSDRYDSARFFRFLKTAEFLDQSWERLYSCFWRLALAYVAFVIASSVLGVGLAILVGAGPLFLLGWVVLAALWPVPAFVVAELRLARRIAKASDENAFSCPPRDPAHERKVYLTTALWGALLYYCAAWLLFALRLAM